MWWNEYRDWLNRRNTPPNTVEVVVMLHPTPADLPNVQPPARTIRHVEADLTIQKVILDRARERHSYDEPREQARLDALLDEWATLHRAATA